MLSWHEAVKAYCLMLKASKAPRKAAYLVRGKDNGAGMMCEVDIGDPILFGVQHLVGAPCL